MRSGAVVSIILSLFVSTRLGAKEAAQTAPGPVTVQCPSDWALGYFQASVGGESDLVSLTIDLDHDGTKELFLGWAEGQSRNGLPFVVFKRSGERYTYLGDLHLQRDLRGFKVLPLAEDGRARIAQYWAQGGCKGTIAIQTHDGRRFVVVKSETICAGDTGTPEGNRRYREIFGE